MNVFTESDEQYAGFTVQTTVKFTANLERVRWSAAKRIGDPKGQRRGREEDPKKIRRGPGPQSRLKVEVINTRQMMMNMKHTNAGERTFELSKVENLRIRSSNVEWYRLNVKAVNEYHRRCA